MGENETPPLPPTLPTSVGKTPTTEDCPADLAAAIHVYMYVDGCNGVICIDRMPSQWLHVIPTIKHSFYAIAQILKIF